MNETTTKTQAPVCFALNAYVDGVACGSADYDAPFTFVVERVSCPSCLRTAVVVDAKAAR